MRTLENILVFGSSEMAKFNFHVLEVFYASGFALFIDADDVERALDVAQRFGYKALDVGYIEDGSRRVVIRPVGVEFKGKDLQIR